MAVAVARVVRFGPELVAAVGYSAWMVVLLFYPGRAHRACNPFGAAARRVWGPLLRLHALALLVLLPMTALGVFVRIHFAPRLLFAVSLVFVLWLSFWQAFRSMDLLETSEAANAEEAR